MNHPLLPDSLAGFQLLCNSTIAPGDLLVRSDSPARPYCWADYTVGSSTDENGQVSALGSLFRVYRKIPVPTPGGTDTNPSTGKLFEVSTPAIHHSDPAPRASEVGSASTYRIFAPGSVTLTGTPATSFASITNAPRTSLPTTAADRKGIPIATGCLDYFPDAIAEVARLSKVGNDQHNPGQPLHWDKSKSTDEADALVRHLLDRGTRDTDGMRHSAKVAWRALALLQREIDAERAGGVK